VCAEQPRIEPRQLFGHSFNISDRAKFNRALSFLRECTDGPMFAADNIITWNKNLSFMRDEYFLEILAGKDADLMKKYYLATLYRVIFCKKLPLPAGRLFRARLLFRWGYLASDGINLF